MTVAPHDKISPTAKFVAYLRTFTDIPYSAEIAAACNAQEAFEQIVGENPQDFLWTAPMIELRYKSVDAVLQRRYAKNILEVACGLTPRGLIWSRDNFCTFIEADLPAILAEKQVIGMDILAGTPRKNLSWFPFNAVEDEFLYLSGRLFPDGPIAVLNEGLLPYLTHQEKEKMARSIHRLLKKRGGVWITPDVSSNDRIKALIELDPKIGRVMQVISGFTGRNMQTNSFGSLEDAEAFFRNIGFKVTKWNQRDIVPDITSPGKIEIDPKKLDVMLERGKVWALEV